MSEKVALSAADILAVGRVGEPTRFHIEAWGVDVFIKDPTVDVIDWLQEHGRECGQDKDGSPIFSQRSAVEVCVRMLCDAEGKMLFDVTDVDELVKTTKPDGWTEALKHCSSFFSVSEEAIETAVGN